MKRTLLLIAIFSLFCACENEKPNDPFPSGGGSQYVEWSPEAHFEVTINGYNATFRDSSKGVKIVYDFGDGISETFYPESGKLNLSDEQRQFTHSYAKKMTYEVTCISYNDKGSYATYIKNITIQ